MSSIQYTTMDRILTILHRDLPQEALHEDDIIEYTSEALEYFRLPQTMRQDERMAFIEVKDYKCKVPTGLQVVIQLTRDNDYVSGTSTSDLIDPLVNKIDPTEGPDPVCVDENGKLLEGYELAYYRPYFDLQWEYDLWQSYAFNQPRYTPIRLTNNRLYKTLVAQLKEDNRHPYQDTYNVIGTVERCFEFSFREGQVVVSYLRTPLDTVTGMPLIPDQQNCINAIVYYIKWKIAERYRWSGREGYSGLAQDSERNWNKYLRQSLNQFKMPQTIDEYQNLLENSLYMIPNRFKYNQLFDGYPKLNSNVRY